MSEDLDQDASLLVATVREAGALALTLQRQTLRRWHKDDGSPVSEADVAVDALLHGKLRAARPGYGWLSEESPDSSDRLACRHIWIADPIDGTRSFLAGGSDWCIAVALIADGVPSAAAIYRPVSEDFYAAVAGGGARRNGDVIRASAGEGLPGARILGTRKSLETLARAGIEAMVPGSLPLQLRLAQVAEGRVDGAVSVGPKNDWDLAAGDLMVREAGGRASDSRGQPFVYNRRQSWQQGLAAAGPNRHPLLIEALNTP